MPEVVIGKDMVTGEIITTGDQERCGGFYILGEPRKGKSHLLISLALQDMKHGHPVLFIDPHMDAIRDIIAHLPLKRQKHVILLDPSDKDYSFGLNPLQCKDPHDPMELDRVYGRVQDIFIKLWGNEQGHLGLWVEKILRNAVYLLLENPGYTLVDIPLLLSEDTTFRNTLLKNVTINPDVKDFWFEEFDRLSPRDKTEQVGPLLSRLDTFRMRILRHIVGQTHSTIDFHSILDTSPTPHIVLLRMPVNLPDTVRSAIGTMLISEMVRAAFDRDQIPEAERRLFAVYCDEFQMFATQDFAKLITQTGKFKLMPHVAHQVREGQLKPDDPNTGATLAAPNKAFFSLSITDSPKVAPLMAKRVEATEKRREAELVISPRPVEDLWERGHPPPDVMMIRSKYFWLVEDLRNNPNEKYFQFDPFRVSPEFRRENPVNFKLTDFEDLEWYRSSAEMLRRGISLLNQYYYDWMQKRYDPSKPITDAQVELIIKVIECWGGVLGFLPMLRPVLPEEKRARLTYMLTEKLRQQFEQDKRDKIQAAKDEIPYLEKYGYKPVSIRKPGSSYWKPEYETIYRKPGELWEEFYWIPGYEKEKAEQYEAQKQRIKDLSEQILTLEQSQPPRAPYIPHTLHSPKDIRDVKRLAIEAGMGGSEVEQLIEWEGKPLERSEKDALADFVTMLVNKRVNKTQYERDNKRIYQRYIDVMRQRFAVSENTSEATDRLIWLGAELLTFIDSCFRVVPRALATDPVKVPSRKYDETLKVERTQNDLIAEMELELSRLDPRTAYVHVVQERNGIQVVRQAKIQTLPFLDPPHGQSIMPEIIKQSHAMAYKPREEIEADIRQRQAKWRRGPDNNPPPTRTGGAKAPRVEPEPSAQMTEPPPTQYMPEKPSEEIDEAEGKEEGRIIDFTAYLEKRREYEHLKPKPQENNAWGQIVTDPLLPIEHVAIPSFAPLYAPVTPLAPAIVAETLKKLVTEQGDSLCVNSERLKSLLSKACPTNPQEIDILTGAVEEGFIAELRRLGRSGVYVQSLARLLHHDIARAEWALKAWATALGLAEAGEDGSGEEAAGNAAVIALNPNPPAYMKEVVAYKEGSDGLYIYFVLADARSVPTTAAGYATVWIRAWSTYEGERPGNLFLRVYAVSRHDFEYTTVGMGQFEHKTILCPLGRIAYGEFWKYHRGEFWKYHRAEQGKVSMEFRTLAGQVMQGDHTLYL